MSETPRSSGGPTLFALVDEAMTHIKALLRSEADLFRAEIRESVTSATIAIGLIVAGIVLMVLSLNILAAALVAALVAWGLAPALSAIVVGGGLAVLAAGFLLTGLRALRRVNLAPTRAARSFVRDTVALKEGINGKDHQGQD